MANDFLAILNGLGIKDLVVTCSIIAIISFIPSLIFKLLKAKFIKNEVMKHSISLIVLAATTVLNIRTYMTDIDYSDYKQFTYTLILYLSGSILIYSAIDAVSGVIKLKQRADAFLDSKGLSDKPRKGK